MNSSNKMLCNLAEWISFLMEEASRDTENTVYWFKGTKDMPFCIVGGWSEGFDEEYSDLLCISKSNPKYAMCVKIAVNDGGVIYTDFDSLNMPTGRGDEVDDTCIALEYADDPVEAAQFFWSEFERIMTGGKF